MLGRRENTVGIYNLERLEKLFLISGPESSLIKQP
jgi:hypothetical protein